MINGFKDTKEMYDSYWKDYFNFDSTYRDHVFVDMCIQEKLDFKKVLDIGCGNGGGVKKFKENGFDAYGLEYSKYIYDNLLKYNEKIHLGDAANLPFKDNSFDLVFSSDVLEHLLEERALIAVKEIYRVTSKYFYGTISNRVDYYKKFHLTIKDYDWWDDKFIKCGFVPVKVKQSDVKVFCYRKDNNG